MSPLNSLQSATFGYNEPWKPKVKKLFLIGILQEHITYIFTLLKVKSYLRKATLMVFFTRTIRMSFRCKMIVASSWTGSSRISIPTENFQKSCSGGHEISIPTENYKKKLVQDNSGVIENEELSGFLKDLLELVRNWIMIMMMMIIITIKIVVWMLTIMMKSGTAITKANNLTTVMPIFRNETWWEFGLNILNVDALQGEERLWLDGSGPLCSNHYERLRHQPWWKNFKEGLLIFPHFVKFNLPEIWSLFCTSSEISKENVRQQKDCQPNPATF